MLILVLIGAILFYAALYILWEMSHSRLNTVESWLHVINSMAVMPDNLVFLILRGLILVGALYVFGDWLKSVAQNTKRRREKRRQQERNPRIGWKKPPVS